MVRSRRHIYGSVITREVYWTTWKLMDGSLQHLRTYSPAWATPPQAPLPRSCHQLPLGEWWVYLWVS